MNVLDYAKKLVSLKSVSGDEVEALEYIKQWLTEKGAEIYSGDQYVAGKITGKKSGNALVLTGHIDTVSAGDLESWNTNPWELTQDGDKLYGLGIADMKSGLASQMTAMDNVNLNNLEYDTWFVVVGNEEVDGAGSANFCEWFKDNKELYENVSAVISEPTYMKNVEMAHRGNCFIELVFAGQAGHGSNQKNFEVSGLGMANKFLNGLDGIYQDLAKYEDKLLGQPSCVPTCLSAGDTQSMNKTSDKAKLILDVRTNPALDKDFESWLDEIAKKYNASWSYGANPAGAGFCSPDAKIAQKMLQLVGAKEPKVSGGATDQTFFSAIGVEAVICGPGEKTMCHKQNEWSSLSDMEKGVKVYEELLKTWM